MADAIPRIAYGGGTLVRAVGASVTIERGGTPIDRFDAPGPVEWLKVAPDGARALIYTDHGCRVQAWHDGRDPWQLASASGPRDLAGCGFARLGGEVLTLVAQNGVLRGTGHDGVDRFTANVRKPHSFLPRNFTALPGDRLAMVGGFFSDPLDAGITVEYARLRADGDAVQDALRHKSPLFDRAVDLAIGPCPPGAAVVVRDPEDTEIPDDDDDEDDLGDVGNFVGLYVRDLAGGALVQRIPYRGRAGSGAGLVATARHVALEIPQGIDIVDRATGAVSSIRVVGGGASVFVHGITWTDGAIDLTHVPPLAAALDVEAAELAVIDAGGRLYTAALADVSTP